MVNRVKRAAKIDAIGHDRLSYKKMPNILPQIDKNHDNQCDEIAKTLQFSTFSKIRVKSLVLTRILLKVFDCKSLLLPFASQRIVFH